MTFRKRKIPKGAPKGTAPTDVPKKLAKQAILSDTGNRVQRFQHTGQKLSVENPGIFASGRRAKPTGFKFRAPRVIPVGSKAVSTPLSGDFRFF